MVRFGIICTVLLAASGVFAAGNTPFYEDKLDLLHYIDHKGEKQVIETPQYWGARKMHIMRNFKAVAGPLPDQSARPEPEIEVLEEVDFPEFTRKKITYNVEQAGDRLPAYLFIPKGLEGKPAPAMLCLHPTSKFGKGQVCELGDKPNRNYAVELAKRGYVTLAPDYPGFGDYTEVDPYALGYESATAKGIWNHKRSMDILMEMPEVDGRRMGAIGHSLGGHNALFIGLFDERIRVVVTSCGFNSFAKYYGGDLTGWSHKGYMPKIASEYDKDPAKMPWDFPGVLGAIAPRPIFISAPVKDANFEVSGVEDCVNAASKVYDLLGAPENLKAVHPDCEHDFPPEVRAEAYAFIDSYLKAE